SFRVKLYSIVRLIAAMTMLALLHSFPFFFNRTPAALIYTLSLHDALPISGATVTDTPPAAITGVTWACVGAGGGTCAPSGSASIDRKSTRLNSSHVAISYAVFCLKKKKGYLPQSLHGPVDQVQVDVI